MSAYFFGDSFLFIHEIRSPLFLFSCSSLYIETFLGLSLALADTCFTFCGTDVLGGIVVLTVLSTGATYSLVGGGKLGTFRDTEDDVIGLYDSDMLWVDDAAEGMFNSLDQLGSTVCVIDCITTGGGSREDEETDNIPTSIKRAEQSVHVTDNCGISSTWTLGCSSSDFDL